MISREPQHPAPPLPAVIATMSRDAATAVPPIAAAARRQSTCSGQPESLPRAPAANVAAREPALNAEHIEPADIHDATDPALPTDPIDPRELTDPMLSTLLRDAIDSTEFVDHKDKGMNSPKEPG